MEAILQEMKGNVMVLGDWNAVVGESPEDDCVGKFGLGSRNDRGQKLVEFCKRNRMMITNTWFKHEKQRRYTWKSPGDYARYQLDYILVKTRYKNSVLNAHTLPGVDADTDHNLLVVKIRVALKKLRKSTLRKRWDKENLKNKIVEFANNVDSKLAQVSPILTDEPDDYWQRFKTVMKQEAEEIIGHSTGPVIKKPWITASMLEMMDQRRQWKHQTT